MKIILGLLVLHIFIITRCQSNNKPAKIVEVTINGADSGKSKPNTNDKSQPNNKNIKSGNLPEIIFNETENKIKINLGKMNDTDKIGQAVQEIVLKHTGNQSLARKIADVVSHVSTLPDESYKKDSEIPIQKSYESQVTRMVDESIDDPKYSYMKLTDGQNLQFNRYSYSPISSNGPSLGISQLSEDRQDQKQKQNEDQADSESDGESQQLDNNEQQQQTGEQTENNDQNEEQGDGQNQQFEGEEEGNRQNQQNSGEQDPQQIADTEETQNNLDVGDSGQQSNGQQEDHKHDHNRSQYYRRIKQRYVRKKPHINSSKRALILKLLKQYLEDRRKQKSN